MAKFCGKCGTKLDEQTGKCPNCDVVTDKDVVIPQEMPKPEVFEPITDHDAKNETEQKGKKKPESKKATPKKTPKPIVVIAVVIVLLVLVASAVVGWMVYSDKLDVPFVNDMFISLGIKETDSVDDPSNDEGGTMQDPNGTGKTTSPDDGTDLGDNYEVPDFDAEKYFEENTTLHAVGDVNASQTVSSESEAYDHFAERGFGDEIFYDYTMDGAYVGPTEISRYSSDKHPMYQAYYTTAAGDIWLITEVNGSFYASPLTYTFANEGKVPVTISETDTITSYDSTTNKFYVNVPHASVGVIKTISRIDAETIEKLTGEEIDKL